MRHIRNLYPIVIILCTMDWEIIISIWLPIIILWFIFLRFFVFKPLINYINNNKEKNIALKCCVGFYIFGCFLVFSPGYDVSTLFILSLPVWLIIGYFLDFIAIMYIKKYLNPKIKEELKDGYFNFFDWLFK